MPRRFPLLLFWLALAAPSAWLLLAARAPDADLDVLVAESGNWAIGFLAAALGVTPLTRLAPAMRWLLRLRRAIGLAAFGTGTMHLILYIMAIGALRPMLAEAGAPGIWTGWAALLMLVPLAVTSSNTAMQALGHNWKRLQRLAYPAVLLALAHMALVHDGAIAALVTGGGLLLLQLTRFARGKAPT